MFQCSIAAPCPNIRALQHRRHLAFWAPAMVALVVAGCSTPRQAPAPVTTPATTGSAAAPISAPADTARPASPSASAPSTPAPVASALPTDTLQGEAAWLNQWFSGTPVRILDETDGSVTVHVPLVYAFEPAQPNTPKAAIRAVMDKVAQSLKRHPNARVVVRSPEPASRADALRDALRGFGLAATRIATAPALEPSEVVFQLLPQ